jgi:spore maturation protein SpmB
MVLELAPRGIEGIAQRNMHVLRVIVIDHYVGARRGYTQAHHELPALVMMLVGTLDHDAAARDRVVELLQLLGPGADVLLQGR